LNRRTFEQLKEDTHTLEMFNKDMLSVVMGYLRAYILRITQDAAIGELLLPLIDTEISILKLRRVEIER